MGMDQIQQMERHKSEPTPAPRETAVRRYFSSEAPVIAEIGARIILNVLFKLPIVAELVKEIDLTRFTRSLYLLLSAGIPIISALELTENVVNRQDISRMIHQSKEMILSGKKLSDGLKNNKGGIPNIMIKMIEAGEKTGSLDKSMQETSDYLDYQVSNTLRTLTTLLEPIMLVFVGVLVGGMMLAIIAPIYSIIGQVGNR